MPACLWRPYGAACFGVVLACSSGVSAQGTVGVEGPLHVAFQYDAPSSMGCPTEPEFRAAVTDLLDYDPFVPDAARTVSIDVAASDRALQGVLSWRSQAGDLEGERRFVSPDADCAKLAQNLAFAVAVQLQLLNAGVADAPPPETPRTDPEQARSEPKPAPVPPAPSGAPAPSSEFELGGGVGPFVVLGWSPEVALGGNLLLLARNRSFSIRLAFEATLPSNFERDDGSGFESSALAASMVPCLRFRALEACSVLRIGQVRVQGFGVDEPRSTRGMLAEAGLRLEVSGALGAGMEGRAHLEAVGTLSSRTVQLNGEDVFSAPAVVFLAGLDLAAFFL